MHVVTRWPRPSVAAALAALTAVAIAACGGSSGEAQKLLRQTFSGAHAIHSGRLSFSVQIRPQGASALKGPITLSFGGPFQSLGAGKLPQSDFNLSLNAVGRSIGLGIISTGTAGYVSFQGSNYALPQADFQKLEASFSSLASSPGSSGGSSVLAKLGIQPLHWLSNPQVVGDESVAGTPTTHIRAVINVRALLQDFNTFLQRAASLGISGASSFPHGLSQSTISRISSEIQSPRFDVWTGKNDKTIRRLAIQLTAPISGQLSALFGRSLAIALKLEYDDLNQPQTITAPSATAPFSQFEARLRALVSSVQSSLGGGLGGSAAGSGSGGGSSGAGSASTLGSYSQCIQAAGNDVAKMQQCASLLSK
jgi:uncharacterized membrane protein YgcG